MRLRVLARRKRKKDDKIRTEYIRTENPDDFPPQVFFWDVLVAHPKSYFIVFFSPTPCKAPCECIEPGTSTLDCSRKYTRIAGECGFSESSGKSEMKDISRPHTPDIRLTIPPQSYIIKILFEKEVHRMSAKNELLKMIDERYHKFSKGQKKLADFIREDYDKAAFLTAAKMGGEVGVSESTVVRFATALGYDGYPEFQKALGELVRMKLNSIQRMEVTYGRISQGEILTSVLHSDIEKIKLTMEAIDHEAFEMAVDTILKAKRIYVIGIRSCSPLASFLSFYLNLICENVTAVNTNSSSEIFEQLIRVSEDDVVIGISFPRYSMRTLKALEFASNRKATVITLTDSVHSPMTLYSSCNLIARSDMASIVDSLVAPLSVINALVVALCMKKQKEVITTLETLEQIWDEYQVYSKDELNMVDDRVELSGNEKE